jgi:hypothetical protein
MRPQYGSSLGFERILNVYFYTSNLDKLFQARLMFVRHGYLLRHFKGDREPYDEDYSLPTGGFAFSKATSVQRTPAAGRERAADFTRH